MAVGFWDMFFDSDYRQRRDINEMREEASYAAAGVDNVMQHSMRLQRQVADLSTLVSVLVRLLEENGQLDSKVLRYRVEAELEAIAAARAAPMPSTPAEIASPPEPQAPTTPTTCGKCKKVVPANRTTITEAGVVCDQCAGA